MATLPRRLAVVGKDLEELFMRYDLDQNGTINSAEEASQLTYNILFALAKGRESTHTKKLVKEGVISKVDWEGSPYTIDAYTKWFDQVFPAETSADETRKTTSPITSSNWREGVYLESTWKDMDVTEVRWACDQQWSLDEDSQKMKKLCQESEEKLWILMDDPEFQKRFYPAIMKDEEQLDAIITQAFKVYDFDCST